MTRILTLGMDTTAEGVETIRQLNTLRLKAAPWDIILDHARSSMNAAQHRHLRNAAMAMWDCITMSTTA
jgi:hypothetical protein